METARARAFGAKCISGQDAKPTVDLAPRRTGLIWIFQDEPMFRGKAAVG
jgi:hypothetical protein